MLPKSNRLTHRESEHLIRNGIALSSSLFTLKAEPGHDKTKCSVAVSKKVAKKAVDRNRLRRRVYASCREVFDTFPEGTHALLFARRAVHEASSHEITKDLERLAQRVLKKI